MRRLTLSISLAIFGAMILVSSLLSSCAKEEKAEPPAVSSAETAKPAQPVERAVDIEAEKSDILKMFDAHSQAVNANRPKGKQNLDDIFKHWIQDNNKNVALYLTINILGPFSSEAETWPDVKNLWEKLLDSDLPIEVPVFQAQPYVATLSDSNIVIKGTRASGTGNGKWGSGQPAKVIALFTKRGGKWYIQALEMNSTNQANRLKPLEP